MKSSNKGSKRSNKSKGQSVGGIDFGRHVYNGKKSTPELHSKFVKTVHLTNVAEKTHEE